MRCPKCNSKQIYLVPNSQNYICFDCRNVFDEEQSTPQTDSANKQNLKKYDIFISYRRDCSINEARSLFNRLNRKYQDKVLRDQDTFEFKNWIEQIVYGVENCKVFISIIEAGTFPYKYVDKETGNIIREKSFNKDDKEIVALYKSFSEMPIVDLVKDLTERVNRNEEIDFVRIEIGRAIQRCKEGKIMFVPIQHRELDYNKLPADVQFRTNNAVFYNGTEFFNIIDEDDRDYKLKDIGEYLFLSRYSKRGKDICAEELYNDPQRTKSQYGFIEDFYCHRENVDGRLEDYINRESATPKSAFLFLAGMPGSGKTRAVYQLCKTGPLQNKDVIILRKDNIVEIADFVIKSEPTDSLYFLCDQIVDVFKLLKDDIQEKLVNKITESNGKYHLIATNTVTRLNDYLKKEINGDKLWDIHSYEKLTIAPELDEEFIDKLILNPNFKQSGKAKTVADLIPGLNKYSKKIYEDSFNQVNNEFKEAWLKALQLVTIFRKENNPLFLAILVLEQIIPNLDKKGLKETLLKSIHQMISSNFFDLYYESDGGNIESIKPNDIDRNFISLNDPDKIDYDGEEIEGGGVLDHKYQDSQRTCTFEIKELVWHYLEEQEKNLLYDFTTVDDVKEAIECWYKAFPKNEISSLTRILPRIPDPTPDIQLVVNNFTKKKLEDLIPDKSKELTQDEIQLYGLLLGRSQCEDEVQYVFDKIQNTPNYLIRGNIVGEWYRYAKNKYINRIEYKKYVEETIRQKVSFLTIDIDGSWKLNLPNGVYFVPNDLYNIRQEYEALVSLKKFRPTFEKLLSYVNMCFDQTRINEGEDILDGSTLTNRDLSSILYLCNLLALSSKAERHKLEELYKLLTKFRLFHENKVCLSHQLYYHLAKQTGGNIVKCKSVTDVFFRNQTTTYSEDPNNWTLQNETDDLKKIFALFLLQAIGRCATFENSIKLYELYICAFGDQEVERFKVLTKVFHNCAQWEYHNMITFWKDLKTNTEIDSNSQKILANVIMEKAPSYEIALEYMKELDERQIDSYSLFHILNHLNKLAKKHPDDELFKKALEVIEDKRLSRFKSEGQILNRLYQIANNEEQEKIVDEIAGETATNRVFVSIKMGKAYRTLEDVYKLYLEFHKNQEQIYSDVFSSMVLRLVKEEEKENANEKIRAELEKECNKKFHLKDSHYLMALIRLGKIAIFNDENGFSNEFLANVDKLDTTDSWRKLIQEYRHRNSGKMARQKRLCAKYIEEFIARKYPYEMYPDYVIKNWLIEFQLDIDNYQADVEAIWEEAFKKEQEKKYEDAIQLYLQIQSVRKYVATRLGQCYRQLGKIEDAVQWTLQGLDEGCFFAPYNLYMIYKYDKYQGFYDIDKAIDYLIIAKERGNKKAKEELEKWYKRFTPLKEHITKSPIIQLTRHSFSVSTILKIGKARSISKDEWYKMGACYYKNEHYMLCVECYHLAADLGHTKAANYLWKWYQDGTYVVKNQLMVRRYLMIAAQFKENKTAAKELKNFQNAENLFQQGMIFYKAALSYNNPYLRTHQDKKFKNAIEKFSEASSKGLAEASHYLGYCHFKGLGTEQNMDKAIEYYKKSAELGYDSSQFSLGQIYETQNMDEAIKWYQLAAEQGHEKAQQRLEQLNGENKCY